MAIRSTIEWTDCTWNPVTGCSHVSEGCANCYAERMAKRLQAMGNPNYADGFAVRCHPHMLSRPLEWSKPRSVFVNSMSDLFHPEVPTVFIQDAFAVMVEAYWHTFQVLTKRPERLYELRDTLPRPHNVWLGVTIENEACLWRLDALRNASSQVRFLSLEPLLGPLPHMDLTSVDWVIVGGESGPGARPMQQDWVRSIRDQCQQDGVAFFFKQWGGRNRKSAGRLLDGHTWDERPLSVVA